MEQLRSEELLEPAEAVEVEQENLLSKKVSEKKSEKINLRLELLRQP